MYAVVQSLKLSKKQKIIGCVDSFKCGQQYTEYRAGSRCKLIVNPDCRPLIHTLTLGLSKYRTISILSDENVL
jgi:hypothetical protein